MNKDYTIVLDKMLKSLGRIVDDLTISVKEDCIEIGGVKSWHIHSIDLFCSKNDMSVHYDDDKCVIK